MIQEVMNKTRSEDKNFAQKLNEFLELFTRLFKVFNSKKEIFDIIIASPESDYKSETEKLNKILCEFLNTYSCGEIKMKSNFYFLRECMKTFFKNGSVLFNRLVNSFENNEEEYINNLIEELYSLVSNIKDINEDNDFEDIISVTNIIKSQKRMKDLGICDLNNKVRIIINITSIKIKESKIGPILVFVSFIKLCL